jgi:hypothetical protein
MEIIFHSKEESRVKVIPIAIMSAPESTCEGDEPSGQVPKLDLPLTRRQLLKGSGILIGVLSSSSALFALAPSPVWAVELKVLSEAEGTTIMQFARTLFPHKRLPDAVYALVAKDLDGGAASDAKSATLLKSGVADLNKAAGGNFASATDAKKMLIAKSVEKTAFFGAVRGKCITSLYDNDMAYAAFGYPGSAWEKGGYITRGFQDLKWLPDPSAEASPAADI